MRHPLQSQQTFSNEDLTKKVTYLQGRLELPVWHFGHRRRAGHLCTISREEAISPMKSYVILTIERERKKAILFG